MKIIPALFDAPGLKPALFWERAKVLMKALQDLWADPPHHLGKHRATVCFDF